MQQRLRQQRQAILWWQRQLKRSYLRVGKGQHDSGSDNTAAEATEEPVTLGGLARAERDDSGQQRQRNSSSIDNCADGSREGQQERSVQPLDAQKCPGCWKPFPASDLFHCACCRKRFCQYCSWYEGERRACCVCICAGLAAECGAVSESAKLWSVRRMADLYLVSWVPQPQPQQPPQTAISSAVRSAFEPDVASSMGASSVGIDTARQPVVRQSTSLDTDASVTVTGPVALGAGQYRLSQAVMARHGSRKKRRARSSMKIAKKRKARARFQDFSGSSEESSERSPSSKRDSSSESGRDRFDSTQFGTGGSASCAVLVADSSSRSTRHFTAAQEMSNHERAVAWSNEGFAHTGPTPCPVCHGYHLDLRTCPSHLARQEVTFKPTPGSSCHWCSGGITCCGSNHFSRHHRAQWIAEHPGASLPVRPRGAKGKGAEGEGAKGKGAKGKDAKGRGNRFVECRGKSKGKCRRVSIWCQDGTEMTWDEEYDEEEGYDEEYDDEGCQEEVVSAHPSQATLSEGSDGLRSVSEPISRSYCSSRRHRAPMVAKHLAELLPGSSEPARPQVQRAMTRAHAVDPELVRCQSQRMLDSTHSAHRVDSCFSSPASSSFQVETEARSIRNTQSELSTFLQSLSPEQAMELRRMLTETSGGYNGLLDLVNEIEAMEQSCANTEALADSCRSKVTEMVQALRDALMTSVRRTASVTVTGPGSATAGVRENIDRNMSVMNFAERLAWLTLRLTRVGAEVTFRSLSQEQVQELCRALIRTSAGHASLLALDAQVSIMQHLMAEVETLAASASRCSPAVAQELHRTYMESPQGQKLRAALASLAYGLHKAFVEASLRADWYSASVTATGPERATHDPLGENNSLGLRFASSPGDGDCGNSLALTTSSSNTNMQSDVTRSVGYARSQAHQHRVCRPGLARAVQWSDGSFAVAPPGSWSDGSSASSFDRGDTEGTNFG